MSNRKRFLAAITAIVAADSLWACAQKAASPGAAASASPDLDHFMALSKILTGYGDLDGGLGNTYLGAQRKVPAQSSALDALYQQSGVTSGTPPTTLADLMQRGVFSDPAALAASSQILANWFSGTYAGADGAATATWNDALAWKACRFTKPPGLCGGETGYWAKPPA